MKPPLPTSTANVGAGWIGQNAPIAVTKMALATVAIGFAKAASIVVYTREFFQVPGNAIAIHVAVALGNAIARVLDTALTDPDSGAISGVRLASIASAATQITSSGTTIANILGDARKLMAVLDGALVPNAGRVWIMSQNLFSYLSTASTSTGEPSFEGMANGAPWLAGYPLYVSSATYGSTM